MGHTIEVRKTSRSRRFDRATLAPLARRVVGRVLAGEGVRNAEVGVLFVDNPVIQALNRRYRRRNRPTDVLAFALAEPDEIRRPGVALGDVVISLPTARRQAEERGHPPEDEVVLLLIHGTLHLLGYDDEEPAAAERMRAKEKTYLTQLKVRSIEDR